MGHQLMPCHYVPFAVAVEKFLLIELANATAAMANARSDEDKETTKAETNRLESMMISIVPK